MCTYYIVVYILEFEKGLHVLQAIPSLLIKKTGTNKLLQEVKVNNRKVPT